jgi:hypothetical protein
MARKKMVFFKVFSTCIFALKRPHESRAGKQERQKTHPGNAKSATYISYRGLAEFVEQIQLRTSSPAQANRLTKNYKVGEPRDLTSTVAPKPVQKFSDSRFWLYGHPIGFLGC